MVLFVAFSSTDEYIHKEEPSTLTEDDSMGATKLGISKDYKF